MLIAPSSHIAPLGFAPSVPLLNSPNWTATELNIWRDRYLGVSPAFKTANDFRFNSPGEGQHIDTQINLNNLYAQIWQCFPQYTTEAVPPCGNTNPGLPTDKFLFIYYGLKYLLTQDASLGNLCRYFLLKQVAEPSCDFGNLIRFPSGVLDDGAPVRQIAAWGLLLLQFYQYTYNLYTPAERQLIDEFFFKKALFWHDRNLNYDLLQNNFDTFGNENYVIKASLNTNQIQGYTHLNGNPVYRPMIINNRRAIVSEYIGSTSVHFSYFGHKIRFSQVGLASDSQITDKINEFETTANNYNKALIIFGLFPDGMWIDSLRGAEDAGDIIGRDLNINVTLDETQYDDSFGYPIVALHCALRYEAQKYRAGRPHLLNYQTDKVYNPANKTVSSSPGVIKSFKVWGDKLVSIYNETAPVMYSRNYNVNPSVSPNARMRGKNAVTGQKYFRHLHYLAEANYLVWRDATLNAFLQGDLPGFGFPPENECFNSGSLKSFTGGHNQTDVTGLKWVGIW
jgi:hypothetical protein